MASPDTRSAATPEDGLEDVRPAITLRSVLLGAATAALLNIYSDYAGMILGSASLVKSQLPMAVLLPFVGWLALNLVLKGVCPRAALTSTEGGQPLGGKEEEGRDKYEEGGAR